MTILPFQHRWTRPRRMYHVPRAAWGLLLAFLLLPAHGRAQNGTIRGTVVDDSTGEALGFVNVFLANTTLGTTTDTLGQFTLRGIPMGMHELVVSQVGYRRISQRIVLGPDTLRELGFRLPSREIRTAVVEVTGMDPDLRGRLLKKFTQAFLGVTENAESCRILNPDRLDFRYDADQSLLKATCDTFLMVQNDALGYRIAIDIDHFTYDAVDDEVRFSVFPRFQPLSGSPDDTSRWTKRRLETFRGSFKHFLATVVAGTWEREMFAVYVGGFPLLMRGQGLYASPRDLLVLPDPEPGIYRLSFQGWLRVEFAGRIPRSVSYVTLLGREIRVDRHGNMLTRFGTRTAGAWSFSRVADMMPFY